MSTALQIAELERANAQLSTQVQSLMQQLDWFKRQLFGRKSEKRLDIDPAVQGNLLAALGVETPPASLPPSETISYQRRKKPRDADTVNDSGLRFDDSVPVQTIEVANPELKGIAPEQLEIIGEKITWRLAQRPGSYTVLKYVRKVVKRRDTDTLHTAPAPANVLERSVADVSLLAGMLSDKFLYHLPLYRQHQRLAHNGIQVSRASLTQWCSRAIELLEPIYTAQLEQVLQSRVLAMDETPIKAGRKGKGKMRQGYFWPMYGDAHEIVFAYASSRAHDNVRQFLGEHFAGTLLSDGYEAYVAYARQNQSVTHAQCWAHSRRHFEQAIESEPEAAAEALSIIGALYRHEDIIREKGLQGEEKLQYRARHSEPVVHAFWRWCDHQCHRQDLLPKNPLSKAVQYVMARQTSLQVFLSDPDVPIDTNHLERALRPIPMGKKSWLFCWTELGAKQVGIIQSLLVTCKLQGVDPYTYLVDVLQRVGEHPASKVVELTPREWKARFASNPMKSDLAHVGL